MTTELTRISRDIIKWVKNEYTSEWVEEYKDTPSNNILVQYALLKLITNTTLREIDIEYNTKLKCIKVKGL